VILVCHALSGDAHVAGLNSATGRPGWWDFHVGPGKAIDTNRFFVVCPMFWAVAPAAPARRRSTRKPGALRHRFSAVTIRDMVRAQRVAGSSPASRNFRRHRRFDGRNAGAGLATDYPERVRNCVPIATCTAHHAMQIAFNEIGRQAILTDPQWRDGHYYDNRTAPVPRTGWRWRAWSAT